MAVHDDPVARVGLAGAISFLVLDIATGAMAPAPPAADASAAAVRTYLADHHGALTVAGVIQLVAPLLVVPFFVAFALRLRNGGLSRIFTTFGIGTVTLAIGGALVQNLLYHAGQLVDNDTALLVLFRLGHVTFDVGPAIPSIGYLMVAACAARTSGERARWLSPFAALVAAITALAVVLGAGTTSGGPSAIGFASFALNAVWIVAAGIVVLRTSPARQSPVADHESQPLGSPLR